MCQRRRLVSGRCPEERHDVAAVEGDWEKGRRGGGGGGGGKEEGTSRYGGGYSRARTVSIYYLRYLVCVS